MGQTPSVPRGPRKSLRSFRSFRRTTSHQGSLSATFTMIENDHKSGHVNINTASEEELMTLPGINRQIAQNIVEYRRVIGRFKKVEDLALVSGIGAEKLDKIRPEICVSKRKAASCSSSRAQSLDSLKSSDSSRLAFKGSHTLKLINVNKANVFDLQCIHGISQELAANIVHYRDKKGPFKSIDGLLKVKGIDAMRLGSFRSQLTVTNEVNEENTIIPTKNGMPSPNANGITNEVHTPRHRKSLSAPMKFSLSLGNGLSKAPINDIFDLLSAYSYRPIVEEDFRYERNGKKAIRISSWNLDRMCLEKAENLGFREVVCRTILENKFSIVAIQDLLDVGALKLICDELNKPTLRRTSEWKDNSRDWNYSISDVHDMLSLNSVGVGFIYDQSQVELTSIKEIPLTNSTKSEAALAKFHIGEVNLSLLNVYIRSDFDCKNIDKQLRECVDDADGLFVMLGDFTDLCKEIDNLTDSSELMNILPLSVNTSSMSINLHHSSTVRYSDNIFLGGSAKTWYTGVSGTVRQGLTHMAIPRGWSWGGPASEHCPVWCELFTQVVQDMPRSKVELMANGKCISENVSKAAELVSSI